VLNETAVVNALAKRPAIRFLTWSKGAQAIRARPGHGGALVTA